jgi:hypothetical protein
MVNHSSDIGIVRVGFHWGSWLLLIPNIGWSQLWCYITRSWLLYLMIKLIGRNIRGIWRLAPNHSSVADMMFFRSLKPYTYFKVETMKKHNSTTFRWTRHSLANVISMVMTHRTLLLGQSCPAIQLVYHSAVFLGLRGKFSHNWDQQSSPEYGSWIRMKPALTCCNSLWMYYSSPHMSQGWKICHLSVFTPIHCALDIVVFFILNMFLSTLNQQMQCTQMVIYQDISSSGAGCLSHSAVADIWSYAWSLW